MKKFTAVLALAAGFSISAFAADYNGYIVDKMCSGNKAMWTNEACVKKCADGGSPVVFVTEDGKVYTVDQAKVKNYFGKKVTVSGNMKGDSIDISSIKGM
jgi:hypothetical protein